MVIPIPFFLSSPSASAGPISVTSCIFSILLAIVPVLGGAGLACYQFGDDNNYKKCFRGLVLVAVIMVAVLVVDKWTSPEDEPTTSTSISTQEQVTEDADTVEIDGQTYILTNGSAYKLQQ